RRSASGDPVAAWPRVRYRAAARARDGGGAMTAAVAPNLSTLVASIEREHTGSANSLFSTLYADLHRMARRELAKRGSGVSLGATTLLHEAYLDISGRNRAAFPDRHRFMAYASRVMRGLIIDYARSRHALKRGG